MTMIDEMSKIEELIILYENILNELKEAVEEKVVVLNEISELYDAMQKIEDRLDQLYEENNDNGEIT